jgi:16S rRNA (guanine527-N7)-methyltransferase
MEQRRARELLAVLEDARARGLTGPGPLVGQVDHAAAWAEVIGAPPPRLLDLGTGGGLPGLVLALVWPEVRTVLLDSRRRSAAWVREAVARLGIADRVEVLEARAEAAGRDPAWREVFPLVVARGFGPPAVTAECGSAFVAPGGRLSVSEPPGADPARWPPGPLAELGLELARTVTVGAASFVLLDKTATLDPRFPRAVGRPARRPLWS